MSDTFYIHQLFEKEFPGEKDHKLRHAFTMGYLTRQTEQIDKEWQEYLDICKKNKLSERKFDTSKLGGSNEI